MCGCVCVCVFTLKLEMDDTTKYNGNTLVTGKFVYRLLQEHLTLTLEIKCKWILHHWSRKKEEEESLTYVNTSFIK